MILEDKIYKHMYFLLLYPDSEEIRIVQFKASFTVVGWKNSYKYLLSETRKISKSRISWWKKYFNWEFLNG